MTQFQRFKPCRAKSRFSIYRDFQLLDAAGPIAAFEVAERYRAGSGIVGLLLSPRPQPNLRQRSRLLRSPQSHRSEVDTLLFEIVGRSQYPVRYRSQLVSCLVCCAPALPSSSTTAPDA